MFLFLTLAYSGHLHHCGSSCDFQRVRFEGAAVTRMHVVICSGLGIINSHQPLTLSSFLLFAYVSPVF